MDNYIIFTDANSDMDASMVEEFQVEVLPMRFTIGGKEYYNHPVNKQMSAEEFYKLLRQGEMSSTTQTNTIEFVELFEPYLSKGIDVLYIGFSSGLSGNLEAAQIAAKSLSEEFPDRKMLVVDTLSISLGQTILIQKASQLKKEGKSIEEVAKWVEDNKQKSAHWFTVDDLNFLKRGGRLSGTAALFGTMLSIKPLLKIGRDGKINVVDKIRGKNNSLMRLVDEVENSIENPEEQTVYVAHADSPDDAQLVADEIARRLNITDIKCCPIGPVIGGHSGPNAIAVFFLGKERA